MDELISRAAAVRALASSNGDYLDALERFEKIPAVDAVPVVRCKDCKYSVEAKNAKGEYRALCGNGQSICCSSHWTLPEDWFCADGERRDRKWPTW